MLYELKYRVMHIPQKCRHSGHSDEFYEEIKTYDKPLTLQECMNLIMRWNRGVECWVYAPLEIRGVTP